MEAKLPDAASERIVRGELKRILTSSALELSQRNRNFLSHVVEETLSGRSDRIKAYSIATQVFGRGDDFDPLQDSIVRIEAARLRRALEHFYLKEGEVTGIRIAIPKGTYVPEFLPVEVVEEPVDAEADQPRLLHELGPRILVHRFEVDGEFAPLPNVDRVLTRQVISALTRFTEIFVYGFDASEDAPGAPSEQAAALGQQVDYKLHATISMLGDRMSVDALLQNARDFRYVWAYKVERDFDGTPDPAQCIEVCAEIAGGIARVIAERDGIIDSQARDSAGAPARHLAGYQKILDFRDYWRTLDRDLFEPVRRDLEATIADDPDFAQAYACLSMLYSDSARYGYDVGENYPDPLGHALELAKRAIQLAPSSSRAYHARAIAEWFAGMPKEAIATLKIARSLNPNDSEIMAELGLRFAQQAEWAQALPLIEESYARNPHQPAAYRMGLFFFHFAHGNFQRALDAAISTDAPAVPYVHVACAAALGAMGRHDKARDRLARAERLAPGLRDNLRADLLQRNIDPDLVGQIMDAIGDADPGWGGALREARRKAG